MHKLYSEYFTFIDDFKKESIKKLSKKVILIFRNYNFNYERNINLLKKLKQFCRKDGRKVFLSNNIKLAKTLNFDGAYIPSFNKSLYKYKLGTKKGFLIIGSAHSRSEILIKEKQQVELIFLSSIFENKKSKKYLGICKFNQISNNTKKKIIALGGINMNNIKNLRMTKSFGLASISFFQKNIFNK